MKSIFAALALSVCAFAQFPPGDSTVPNPSASSVSAVTSLAINVSDLHLTSIDPAQFSCKSGTAPTFLPVAITSITQSPSSGEIATITLGFSSVANVRCSINATGGTGADGGAGSVGPAAWKTPVAWSSGGNYAPGPPADVVTYNGETYVSYASSTNITPGTDGGVKWTKVASKGSTGGSGPAAWTTPSAWNSVTTYSAGPPASVVTYGGETFVAVASSTNVSPDSDGSKWVKVAQRGGASYPQDFNCATSPCTLVVTHNLNSADAVISIKDASGKKVETAWSNTSANVITVDFATAQSGRYVVVAPSIGNTIQGISWRGPWYSLTSYTTNEAVSYNGTAYIAVAASTNVTPGTDGTKWGILAQQGSQGSPGAIGGANAGNSFTCPTSPCTLTITHNLNSTDAKVFFSDGSGASIDAFATAVNANTASVTFATAQSGRYFAFAPAAGSGTIQGIAWRGAWSSVTGYSTNEAVSYNGSAYIAVATSTNVPPGTDSNKWGILAQQGAQGPAGPTGGANTANSFTCPTSPCTLTITHNLNNIDAQAFFTDGSGQAIEAKATTASANSMTVTFATAQSGRYFVFAPSAGSGTIQGIAWRGAWSSATGYSTNEAVSYNGSAYIAVATSTNVTPGTDGAKWGVLVQAPTTVSALTANGTNCSAGSYPLGVDASGNSEGCTAVTPAAIGAVSKTGDETIAGNKTFSGSVNVGSAVSEATLGAELVSNTTFASLTGWTDSGINWSSSSGAAHAAGVADTLRQTIAVTSGATYQIAFTISAATAGTIAVDLGGVSLMLDGPETAFPGPGSYVRSLVANASGVLTITPTSTFAGTISTISVKQVIGSTSALFSAKNADGSVGLELRAGGSDLKNTFLGLGVGQSTTPTGTNNAGVGYKALYANVDGVHNVAIGANALTTSISGYNNVAVGSGSLQNNTSGAGLTAVGYLALNANTTGYDSAGFGEYALWHNTTGYANTAIGMSSLRTNVTGNNNTALGVWSLFAATGNNNVGIGYFAGAYETGSNAFYLDNQDRGNTAGDKANALLYGTFGANADAQTLKINGVTRIHTEGDTIPLVLGQGLASGNVGAAFSLTQSVGNGQLTISVMKQDSGYGALVLGTASGGTVKVPVIKSTTGNRYVCVSTDGTLVSQASACSGT